MFAQVYLLNGFEKPLWYKVPERLCATVKAGTIVRVPLQQRYESALITDVVEQLDYLPVFKIKEIVDISAFPHDAHYHAFLEKLSSFYFLEPLYFYQRIRHFLSEKALPVVAALDAVVHDSIAPECVALTYEQQNVVDYVAPYIKQPEYAPTLIHGVTGSGKTEVYKALFQQTIEAGKAAIFLLPEVTLALQFQILLQKQLPNIRIIGFHSASKIAEKRSLWDVLIKAEPVIIVGVHLPIVLPLKNLGLIVVDEEHELGFQEKKNPKLNSKEIALLRAQQYKIPIVLGSATPSVVSLYNAQRYNWKLCLIKKRFAGAFPVIEKVILTQLSNKRRKAFWVSPQLEQAIRDRLQKKEQIIIFLNRRGYSFFVQCKECGFTFQCSHCSVSLTFHEPTTLRCHYCDYVQPLAQQCPACKAHERELLKKGIGTQQVVRIFQELFPSAVIARADMDSTSKKRSWQQTVELFQHGSIDILIGTQTITKGYHFPKVTLVGVLWADLNLHFPLYNASETTLQQLIQVAGRAGRQCEGGKVIIQAMHDHEIFEYIDEQRYIEFCKKELDERQEAEYPPFIRLASIEIRHKDSAIVDHDARFLATALHEYNNVNHLDIMILGPALPIVYRIQNYEMRTIVCKAVSFKQLHQLLKYALQQQLTSNVFLMINQ